MLNSCQLIVLLNYLKYLRLLESKKILNKTKLHFKLPSLIIRIINKKKIIIHTFLTKRYNIYGLVIF